MSWWVCELILYHRTTREAQPKTKCVQTANSVVMNTGVQVSFNSGFLGVYAQQWDCWVIWQFHFQFFKESPHCSP